MNRFSGVFNYCPKKSKNLPYRMVFQMNMQKYTVVNRTSNKGENISVSMQQHLEGIELNV